jgi:hypothetical protein
LLSVRAKMGIIDRLQPKHLLRDIHSEAVTVPCSICADLETNLMSALRFFLFPPSVDMI